MKQITPLVLKKGFGNIVTMPKLHDNCKDEWLNLGLMLDKDLKPSHWLFVNLNPYTMLNNFAAMEEAKKLKLVLPTVAELRVFFGQAADFLYNSKWKDVLIHTSETIIQYDESNIAISFANGTNSLVERHEYYPELVTFFFHREYIGSTTIQ